MNGFYSNSNEIISKTILRIIGIILKKSQEKEDCQILKN